MRIHKLSRAVCFFSALTAAILLVFAAADAAQQQTDPENTQGTQTLVVIPEGWVRVGYDLNNDGTADAYEYIFSYDLQQARSQSSQRMQAQNMQQQGMQQQGKSERQFSQNMPQRQQQQLQSRQYQQFEKQPNQGLQQQARRSQMQSQKIAQRQRFHSIEGTIQDLRTIRMAGVGDENLIAKVKTDEGRLAKVDLGPSGALSDLNLQPGAEIMVYGRRGTINEQPALIAARVSSQGRMVTVMRPRDMNQKVFTAQVLDARTADLQNAPNQLFARVQLDTGTKTLVNLGPQKNLQNLNLEQGQKIDILARPAIIQGKLALVADQVRAGNQTYDIQHDLAQQQKQQPGQQQMQQQQPSGTQQGGATRG